MLFPIDVSESDFKISTHYKRSCCLSFSVPFLVLFNLLVSFFSLVIVSLGHFPSATNYLAASAHLLLYFEGDSSVVFFFGDSFNINYIYTRSLLIRAIKGRQRQRQL